MNRSILVLAVTFLAVGLLAALPGCSKEDDPAPPPDPIQVLIDGGGGTGGGDQGGTVTVVVIDEQDRTRVSGATAFLNDGVAIPSQTTDASGTAVFGGVPAGAYSVTVVKAGFVNSTWFGVHAAIVVVPLESHRIRVSGTVTGGSGTGHTYTIEFSTIEHDPFAGDSPKYGEVTDTPATGDMSWEVEIDKGRTDTLTFTETNTSSGRIVNRKTLAVGPYAADQAGVNVAFDGTTGLHEITGTITQLDQLLTTAVAVVHRDGRKEYRAYSVTGSGTTRTYSLQLPPNRSCDVWVQVNLFLQPNQLPNEAQKFTVSTGAADNGTPVSTDLPLNMATVSGTFTGYGAATLFPLYATYDGITIVKVGTNTLGYSMRMPAGVGGKVAIQGLNGSNVLERGIELPFGPFNINTTRNYDLASAAPTLLNVTSNLPARITTDNATVFLAGLEPDDDIALPAFSDAGTVGGSNLTFDLRYFPLSGVSWVFSANDQDNADDDESIFIRGNMGSPSDLGATLTLTFLEVPQTTSPAAASNQNKQVPFAWTADANLAANGFTVIDITNNATGDKLWGVAVEGSLSSATLPALPASVAALELQTGVTYRWKASAIAMQNLDFDNFNLDLLNGLLALVKCGREVRVASTTEITFTVN